MASSSRFVGALKQETTTIPIVMLAGWELRTAGRERHKSCLVLLAPQADGTPEGVSLLSMNDARPAPVARKRSKRPLQPLVLPLPWSDAVVEAERAIAYAERHQRPWFWRGGRHTAKWRAEIRDNLNRRALRH
jgi:hypothetical protein